MENFDYCSSAHRTIQIELAAVKDLPINHSFVAACELILACKGKVITCGVGKSGHIARKVAATLASTGSPALFVHPTEATHGDLGMITAEDVVILFSYSGNSEELVNLLPSFKRLGVKSIAISGYPASQLAQRCDVSLLTPVKKEACPLNLAPTASSTAALVLGDALAVALLEARGFSRADFALSHPSGSLGRKLLLKVDDVMRSGVDLPTVKPDVSIVEALWEVSSKKLGMTCVIDANRKLLGVFTDGDLRRSIDSQLNLRQTPVQQVMTKNCVTVNASQLAVDALGLIEEKKISSVAVVDAKFRPIGVLSMHDLLQAKVV